MRWEAERVGRDPGRYLSASSSRGTFPTNRHFFAAIKDLRREPVKPEIEITQTEERELQINLQSKSYAYFVHLEVPDEATRFSDNYFDLEPGEERTVFIINDRMALTPEMVKVGWR